MNLLPASIFLKKDKIVYVIISPWKRFEFEAFL